MFIHLISGLIFLYLLCRLVLPLRVGAAAKAGFGLLLLLVSQQHLFNRYVFGGMASPELPPALLMLQGGCFISLLFLLLLTLLNDAAAVLRLAIIRRRHKDSAFSGGRRQALLLMAAAIPAVYGVREAIALPGVRTSELLLARLPEELDGLKLAHITDLHVSSLFRAEWVREVVRRVNALEPDLILITGDMVDGPPALRHTGVAPLRDFKSRYGVFACPGNHEYYSNFNAWMEYFPSLGITVLQNSHTVLSVKGCELVLAGVTDVAAKRFSLPLPDCAAALRDAPKAPVRILLDHRPGNAEQNAPQGVDLQLSGHTHGGHMFGMRRLVARFNGGYVYGWYKVGEMDMYVSSGVGLWSGFPARLGVPSEIASIVLRSV